MNDKNNIGWKKKCTKNKNFTLFSVLCLICLFSVKYKDTNQEIRGTGSNCMKNYKHDWDPRIADHGTNISNTKSN
jgi:hypothetical protein